MSRKVAFGFHALELHYTGCALWCEFSFWPDDADEPPPCGHASHDCTCDELALLDDVSTDGAREDDR
jgi:hypothetical protein